MFFAFFCCAIWAFLQRYRCFEAFTSALQLCSSWLIRPSFVPRPMWGTRSLNGVTRAMLCQAADVRCECRKCRFSQHSQHGFFRSRWQERRVFRTADSTDIGWHWYCEVSTVNRLNLIQNLGPAFSRCVRWWLAVWHARSSWWQREVQSPEISRDQSRRYRFRWFRIDKSRYFSGYLDDIWWVWFDQTWSDSKALDLVGTTKSSCYRCFFPWWVPWQAASSWSADIGPKGAGHAMVFAHHPLGSCGTLWRSLWVIWVWVNTYRYIFSGMNIHLPAILGFTIGTRVLTHPHFFQIKHSQYITFTIWLWLTVRYGKIHHL